MVIIGSQIRHQRTHHHIDDDQAQGSESYQGKSHDGTGIDRHIEGLADVLLRRHRGAGIALYRDLHADIASGDGNNAAEEEGYGGIDTFPNIRGVGIIDKQGDNSGENHHEDGQEFILLFQKRHGAFCDGPMNKLKTLAIFCVKPHIQRHGHHLLHKEESNHQAEQT